MFGIFEGVDWSQVVACAPRPEGSWLHLATLVAFVLAAGWLAPRAGANTASGRAPRLPRSRNLA